MPRTRSLTFAELKIGIIALVALFLTAVVIFMLSGQGGLPWQRYYLKARFDNVAGLKPGAPVRLAGIEVGSVKDIQLVGSRVDVLFEVARTFRPQITERSRAALGSISLLGQATIDLTATTSGTPVSEWGYVTSTRVAQFADVTTTANDGLQEATRLLQDIRAGRGTVDELFTDRRLYDEIDRFVTAADAVATNLNRGRGTVGKLMNDPAAANALQASLENLEAITRQINSGEGSLGRLVRSDEFERSLTSASGNVDALTRKLNGGEGTAGKLLTDASLFNRVNALAGRLDALTTRLNEGQGTVGRLLQDHQLYDNLNGAIGELKDLIAAIKKDPRKYLNVKMSLF